jgi:cell surface protein SprA
MFCSIVLAGRFPFFTAPQSSSGTLTAGIKTECNDTISKPTDGTPRRQSQDIPDEQDGKLADPEGVQLKNPSNVKSEVEYDPVSNSYLFKYKVGSLDYRTPTSMSLKEYSDYEMKQAVHDYWGEKASAGRQSNKSKSFAPSFNVNSETFDKIFGTNAININLQGSAELIFGFQVAKVDNPTIAENLRTTSSFNFNEKVQMNARGTIGDRLKVGIEYNTDATFDFENKVKLEYTGGEDDIVKKIEAGNVSLPLSGSLIPGSQGLFGVKTELQFGKMTVTAVASQQKSESSTINVQGGSQVSDFQISAGNYEANKHFFLSHYFKNNYDNALSSLPTINSVVNITKIQVWITNKTKNYTNSRNIVGFIDLGESSTIYNTNYVHSSSSQSLPSNSDNNLYGSVKNSVRTFSSISLTGYTQTKDYEKLESARLLSSSEYTYNAKLGYISLNSALNSDEILAVAFQYTANGKTYQVGEFTSDISAPSTLIVKLLKGTSFTPSLPNWHLMMKNIYALNASQISSDKFILNVLYDNSELGTKVNYLPVGSSKIILLSALNLDRLNTSLQTSPDGLFDFVDGYTINATQGRVIFPVREPFGSYLKKYLTAKGASSDVLESYVYQALYDSTQTKAKLITEKNKYYLKGSYQSASGSEIQLNATNIPEGSVKVTAGGQTLTEGSDYTVDYTLGKVKIINSGILESGSTIQISLESSSLYNIQTKTFVGTHLDYKVNDNLLLGGTVVNLTERSLTDKVSYGNDAVSNTMWGLNASYKADAPLLTKLVDKLPLIQTKENSTIKFTGEFAQLIANSSNNGDSYIDDFEGAQTGIDLKTVTSWSLASIPQEQDSFPEASLTNNLAAGYNRAKLAWYNIDPLFLRNYTTCPSNIKNNSTEQKSHFTREIYEKEVFPNKESTTGVENVLSVLNLAFYPKERGPYNYDTKLSSYSKGVASNGLLNDPETRWAGIQRAITTTNFESNNITYIEFWLMDPYAEGKIGTAGDLYFNLGNVSEDVLKDSQKSFENGLPTTSSDTQTDTTAWGIVSTKQAVTTGFSTDGDSRAMQDVGLDGLSDTQEQSFFSDYISNLKQIVSSSYVSKYQKDPSSDNYHYFRGSDYDNENLGILARYKNYNGLEANSPTSDKSPESYATAATTTPNSEDINNDNTLNETEAYYQYRISMRKEDLKVGKNFVNDTLRVTPSNGNSAVTWYQFKVPISSYDKAVGGISDFTSIRFMRMFLKGFSDSTILRFATLKLIRDDWQKYTLTLKQGTESTATQPDDGTLNISTVSIEENSSKTPVNYVLPDGVSRQVNTSSSTLALLDEQSMVLKVSDLADADARAAYKTVSLDLRNYKYLKMDMHAEAFPNGSLSNGELSVFIRMGADLTENYYEYEVPAIVTPAGTYSNSSSTDRLIVWPESNRFNILLSVLKEAKEARNTAMSKSGTTVTYQTIYPYTDGSNRVYVCGNPTLGSIKTIMIGVRNRKGSPSNTNSTGRSLSGEIWVDELRLTDPNNSGGWAANGQLQLKLADLGMLNISGSMSTPGWGSISQSVTERSLDRIIEYDINTNLELGKFFPKRYGVSIPFYADISESFTTPKYNPLDNDELLSSTADSIKKMSVGYTLHRSFSLSNLKIQPQGSNTKLPWSIANWTASFSFKEIYSHDINTEYYLDHTYKGNLTYTYLLKPKNYQPFSSLSFLDNNAFRLIKDFNFYLLPSSFSFRNELQRDYTQTQIRNISTSDVTYEPTVSKSFTWNRLYDLKYNLTRSLKLNFSATNTSYIDELDGIMDKSNWTEYQKMKEEILSNLLKMGRTTSYTHQVDGSYITPINKLPGLDWTSLNVIYRGTYTWDAQPLSSTTNIGNTLENSMTLQYNGSLNFKSLYNKVPYLRRLDQKYSGGKKTKAPKLIKITEKQHIAVFRANRTRILKHKLKSKEIKVVAKDQNGTDVPLTVEIITADRIRVTPKNDARNVDLIIEASVPEKDNWIRLLGEGAIRFATELKSVSFSYSDEGATYMPGYMNSASLFGSSSITSPGLSFILGLQDENFDSYAYQKGWLVSDTSLTLDPITYKSGKTLNLRASLEPITDLKIELQTSNSFSTILNRYYNSSIGKYDPSTDLLTGSYNISVWTFNSAFEKLGESNSSPVFERFKSYRTIISNRLANLRQAADKNYVRDSVLTTGDTISNFGYTNTSQDVLLPAFLAAYLNKDPNKIDLNFMSGVSKLSLKSLFTYLRPSWRVTYSGLTRIPLFAEYVRSIVIGHAYSSSFIISSFSNNSAFIDSNHDGFSDSINTEYNYISKYDLGTIAISEQFSPLINVDITWKNNLSTSIGLKRSRSVTLSFANNQIMEILAKEYIFSVGYRFDDLPFNIITPSVSSKLKNSLNMRLDVSFKNDKTILRKLTEGYDEITDGKDYIKFYLSADYQVSEKINIKATLNRTINNPFVSTSYKTVTTEFTISLKLQLM